MTIVGNNKLFGDNIHNYSANTYRRVALTVHLNAGEDLRLAIALLKEKIPAIPFVMTEPASVVEILEFNSTGTVLAVRPFCHNEYYPQVLFATNKTIYETLIVVNYLPLP